MKPMSLFRHTIAYVILGLLCGWYYFIFLLYPTLIILALRGSYVAGSIFAFFLFLTYVPLSYEPWEDFMYCWIWGVWKEYFDFTYDDSSIKGKLKDGERYIFFEFPHGIFPMGQGISFTHSRYYSRQDGLRFRGRCSVHVSSDETDHVMDRNEESYERKLREDI